MAKNTAIRATLDFRRRIDPMHGRFVESVYEILADAATA
jgi:hypothetical protein